MPAGPSVDWLLEGPAWLERLVRRDLVGEDPLSPDNENLRRQGLADPPVAEWLALLEDWPGPPLKSHRTLSLLIHKLDFLADIGLRHGDPESRGVAGRILEKASPEGPFRLPILLPKVFGGSGEVEDTWMLTDAPVVAGAMAKLVPEGHPKILAAAAYIAGLVQDNGWRCAAAPEIGRFSGPGRKGDPCPYANIISLRMLSDCGLAGDCSSRGILSVHYEPAGSGGDRAAAGEAAAAGISSVLDFWDMRGEKKLRMFGIGTDFMKLKAPFVWFDVLHVLEVLSRFPAAREDGRYSEILNRAVEQADEEGRFSAGSVYRPASGFDFGNRKEPSRWISFLMARILKRSG